MSGHTPGPWIIEDGPTQYDYLRLYGMDGKVHMGYLNKQPSDEAMQRVWADAYLWRAAPDMEEILTAWQVLAEESMAFRLALTELPHGIGVELLERTQAALAKARGDAEDGP